MQTPYKVFLLGALLAASNQIPTEVGYTIYDYVI